MLRAPKQFGFLHLTFQEYFASKYVHDAQSLLPDLANRIGDDKWREVILLTASQAELGVFLPLLKAAVDRIVAGNPRVQEFLEWVRDKAAGSESTNSHPAVRAFYASYALGLARVHHHGFSYALGLARDLDLDLDRPLFLDLNLARSFSSSISHSLALDLNRDLDRSLDHYLDLALIGAASLNLGELLRNLRKMKSKFAAKDQKWWRENGSSWREQLRQIILKHRDIGREWNFSSGDRDLFRIYCDANRLLVQCLKTAHKLLRQQIEETLLLPAADLKRAATS